MLKRRLLLSAGLAASTIAGISPSVIAAPAKPKAAAARGVVGITLPISSSDRAYSMEMRTGYEAALTGVADLLVEDDGGDADRVQKIIEGFSADARVAVVSGVAGTAAARKTMGVATAGQLPVIGIQSGASELRNGNPFIYHLRASYEDELDKAVDTAAVYGTVAVLYMDDDFGRSALGSVQISAATKGLTIKAAMPIARDGSNIKAQIATMLKTQPIASVVMVLEQKNALAAAKELRGVHRQIMPIFGLSFLATTEMARAVDTDLKGVSVIYPFPFARTSVAQIAREFRERLKDLKQEELLDSPACYQGFFYGSVIAEALQQGGGTRKGVQAFLNAREPFEVRGVNIRFDSQRVGYRYLTLLRKEQGAAFRST